MTSFPDSVKSRGFVVFLPSQPFHLESHGQMIKMQKLFMDFMQKISFQTQMADCRLRAVTLRSLILAGAMPSLQIGQGQPKPFPKTMADLLDGVRKDEPCTVRATVNRTINDINFNGLQPFNKTVKQILGGRSFLETRIDSTNEEKTGSTCVGMTHALLKQLLEQHRIEGMFAAQRKKGKAFGHASVIVECTDGYVLFDPRSHKDHRIFQIPFDRTLTILGKTFTAATRGFQIPITQTDCDGEFEYCTNIANAGDLIMKHFIMDAPFNPPENPAFPISAYYLEGEKTGRGSRTIWVSYLQKKVTFKNDTVEGASERTIIISFEDVLKDGFRAQLERFYVAGKPPTFNIDVGFLHDQLVQFVTNTGIIDEMFREIYSANQMRYN